MHVPPALFPRPRSRITGHRGAQDDSLYVYFRGAELTSPPTTTVSLAEPVWHAESLRLTAFWNADARVESQEWWAELVGRAPETRTSRPKAGEFLDQGPYEGGNLTLSIRPERVDWQLSPLIQEEEDPSFLEIGPMSTSFPPFIDTMKRWLSKGAPITRLALGVVLHLPAPSKEKGYERLASFLKTVTIDPKGSSDFLYQINRPRKTTVGITELTINRLSIWSVAASKRFRVVASADGAETWNSPAAHSCRLQVDVNTPSDYKGNLPAAKLHPLLDELVDLALEISTKGDIP